ncbi:MAG: TRAP transporter small permease subunit [Deltaproteobacteria bacterium]|nr:TRAP transporter small permease subunit [Deltaproteobacteria bacterium]
MAQQESQGSTLSEGPRISQWIDRFVVWVSSAAAWLNVVLVVVILAQVILRYTIGWTSTAMEELQWHLYGTAAFIAVAYAVVKDAHVRLDLFFRKMSPRTKAWVDLLSISILLLPMCVVMSIHGAKMVEMAFRIGESSPSPMGMSYRWAIKAVIPFSMALYGSAGISRMIRSAAVIMDRKVR